MASQQVWCEFAVLPAGVAAGVVIDIVAGTITRVEAGIERDVAPIGASRLDGLTLPGIANAHSHAFHRALRGRTHGGRGDFFSWRDEMYAVAARLTPASMRAIARATFAEMLCAGFTAVGEFHYVHHTPDGASYDEPNAMGSALLDAAHDVGIRITLLDACYLRGGPGRPLEGAQRRFSDGDAAGWRRRVDALRDQVDRRAAEGQLARMGAAIHSLRAVDATSAGVVAAHAHASGMPLHAHVSEQPAENEQVFAELQRTPVGALQDARALSPSFTAVHATHLTGDDIASLGDAGAMCCFCPTTERDLADGIGPSPELVDAGVGLCIGTDQHAEIDPFVELRAVEHAQRLRSLRRGTHNAGALLTMGTVDGYRSLGWPDGGRLEPGAHADLITVSLGSVRLAGSVHPAISDRVVDAVVFAASASDVSDVHVAGERVVRGHRHARIDVARELDAAIAALVDR